MQINTCAVYNTYHICVCDACAHNTFTPSARNNLHIFFFNHSTVWQVRPAASSLTLESMPHQRLVNLGPAQNYHKFVQNMTNPVGHQKEQKNNKKNVPPEKWCGPWNRQIKSPSPVPLDFVLALRLSEQRRKVQKDHRELLALGRNPIPGLMMPWRPSSKLKSSESLHIHFLWNSPVVKQKCCFNWLGNDSASPSHQGHRVTLHKLFVCAQIACTTIFWFQALQGLNSFIGPGPSDYVTYLFNLGQLGWPLQEGV